MNREDTIKMAREAGLLHESDTAEIISECGVEVWLSPSYGVNMLERFAALVAAAERESLNAYIKALEDSLRSAKMELPPPPYGESIRARGQ